MKFQELLKRRANGNFSPIKAGKFEMSIQGSRYHYSAPRIETEPENYIKMEVAIFGEDGQWVNPHKSLTFDWGDLFEQGRYPVAGYVPIKTIQQMYDDLSAIE